MAEKKQQIKVNLPKDVAEGEYANIAFINHNNAEFVLDFGRLLPGIPEAKICSRVVMTPQHCKRLMQLLQRNIKQFETNFGDIHLPEIDEKKDIGFHQ